MNRTWKALTLGAACSLLAAAAQGANITYAGPADGSWNDPNNWNINGLPAGREPSSTYNDYVFLGGTSVHVTASSSLQQFGASGGNVHIDAGGILTGTQPYTVRYVTHYVNDGGLLPLGTAWSIRSNITVNEGGEMTGGNGIANTTDSRTLTVNGTFSPRGTVSSAGTSFTLGTSTYYGRLDVGTTGTLILDLYGNGNNEYINVFGPSANNRLTLNAAGSRVLLRPQGGYVPQPGDAYTLWTLASGSLATMNIGDGSNIALVGSPHLLDTTRWATEGVVTVVKAASPGTVLVVN